MSERKRLVVYLCEHGITYPPSPPPPPQKKGQDPQTCPINDQEFKFSHMKITQLKSATTILFSLLLLSVYDPHGNVYDYHERFLSAFIVMCSDIIKLIASENTCFSVVYSITDKITNLKRKKSPTNLP